MAQDLICGRQAAKALDQAIRNPEGNPPAIQMVYISDSFPAKLKKDLSALLGKGPVQTVSGAELSKMTDLRHQGIVIRLKAPLKSGGLETKETGLKTALAEKPGLYIMLDRIQDEQNLGSIARSAEALGVRGLIITGKGARPGSVAARVSAGATMLLPIFETSSQSVVKTARSLNYWLLGADYDPSQEEGESISTAETSGAQSSVQRTGATDTASLDCWSLDKLPSSDRFILVIGSEGDGLKSSLLEQCDYKIHIPLRGRTASLNAGVAAAILTDRLMQFLLRQK
ncbi:MAG: hypothetical protein CMN76_15250 [Spirochaetaceae bacterium]|nr:hypothetical protein [Spirochaetaceae bacterium]|tara:strand:- start:4382 stop:5236 length:855 start_codon:yes stop_codon:yes gene_type:complete